MGYLDAELDLGPIDKVDVRNELRRFTVFPGIVPNFPNFASYCNLCVSVKYVCDRPAVTLCHARLSRFSVTLSLTVA